MRVSLAYCIDNSYHSEKVTLEDVDKAYKEDIYIEMGYSDSYAVPSISFCSLLLFLKLNSSSLKDKEVYDLLHDLILSRDRDNQAIAYNIIDKL